MSYRFDVLRAEHPFLTQSQVGFFLQVKAHEVRRAIRLGRYQEARVPNGDPFRPNGVPVLPAGEVASLLTGDALAVFGRWQHGEVDLPSLGGTSVPPLSAITHRIGGDARLGGRGDIKRRRNRPTGGS